jgi:cytochrome c553
MDIRISVTQHKERTMKQSLIAALCLALVAPAAWAVGDPVAGEAKAAACMMCHGTKGFPGIFYTLQLAGRDADKLVIKTNKYRSGKILHPIMNLSVLPLTDKDVEDIAAFYHSLGKPIIVSPLIPIKGDEDEPAPGAAK